MIVVAASKPLPGEEVIVYSRRPRAIGEDVVIVNKDGAVLASGIIDFHMADDPRYQTRFDGRGTVAGQGYYRVKLSD